MQNRSGFRKAIIFSGDPHYRTKTLNERELVRSRRKKLTAETERINVLLEIQNWHEPIAILQKLPSNRTINTLDT